MQGLATTLSSKIRLIVVCGILLLELLASVAHGSRLGAATSYNDDEACKRMTIYYHDILSNGENAVNATAAVVSVNNTFGQLVVFDDPVTTEQVLSQEPVARAHGLYFYDKKDALHVFTLVFDSAEYKGTLDLMGAGLVAEKTMDLSIIGGTGDFFLTRGVATISTDSFENLNSSRSKMDIKLYECHV